MKVEKLSLSGVLLITQDVYPDKRGFFMETYRQDAYREHGISAAFVQDSHSHSKQGVIRGIKFQYDEPTDKLVRVAYGSVFAVAVDLRPHSLTFGKFEKATLSDENKKQLYIPFGFGFGFCATSEEAGVLYKLSAIHNEKGSGTICPLDPDLAIPWPSARPILSSGDVSAPTFQEWAAGGGPERFRSAAYLG